MSCKSNILKNFNIVSLMRARDPRIPRSSKCYEKYIVENIHEMSFLEEFPESWILLTPLEY